MSQSKIYFGLAKTPITSKHILRTIPSKVLVGSIIVPKGKILCGLIQECESGKQFQWQKIGCNQVKYRSRKLTNNPKQGLDCIYHFAEKQDPMWFGSGMRVRKPECVKWMNEHVTLAKTIVPLLPFGLGGGQKIFWSPVTGPLRIDMVGCKKCFLQKWLTSFWISWLYCSTVACHAVNEAYIHATSKTNDVFDIKKEQWWIYSQIRDLITKY